MDTMVTRRLSVSDIKRELAVYERKYGRWVAAIYRMCASRKGVTSLQLMRELDITYKTAWFMTHRIRYAMTQLPLSAKLETPA
jgi:hypothetical protein